MNYTRAYEQFVLRHKQRRNGERLRRLEEGHGYAEECFLKNVWWPAFAHFEDLHPEYEVSDFRDGTRFLDFAYVKGSLRLAIEIDGYGPHLQKISRTQFSDQLIRQNHLIIDGWKILRFSFDDVKERPRMCEQIVQQFMGRWLAGGAAGKLGSFTSEEKEILRFATQTDRSFTPIDICLLLQVEKQKARKLLHGLMGRNILSPAGQGRKRIRFYRLSIPLNPEGLQ